MHEYHVKIDDKSYNVSVENITNTPNSSLTAQIDVNISVDATRQEYEHCIQRSEKLDNKIYITLTICAFLFILITDTIKKIENFSFPNSHTQLLLIIIFSITLTLNIFLYTYTLINLTHLLKGVSINRFDPLTILQRDMVAADSMAVARYICSMYNQCIKFNNASLEKRFAKYNKCVICMLPIVFLSFILIFISNFIH